MIEWEAWRNGARPICKEESIIQKNRSKRIIAQKFSDKKSILAITNIVAL